MLQLLETYAYLLSEATDMLIRQENIIDDLEFSIGLKEDVIDGLALNDEFRATVRYAYYDVKAGKRLIPRDPEDSFDSLPSPEMLPDNYGQE